MWSYVGFLLLLLACISLMGFGVIGFDPRVKRTPGLMLWGIAAIVVGVASGIAAFIISGHDHQRYWDVYHSEWSMPLGFVIIIGGGCLGVWLRCRID